MRGMHNCKSEDLADFPSLHTGILAGLGEGPDAVSLNYAVVSNREIATVKLGLTAFCKSVASGTQSSPLQKWLTSPRGPVFFFVFFLFPLCSQCCAWLAAD